MRRSSSDIDEADSVGAARWEHARLAGVARGGSPSFVDVSRSRFPFSLVWSPLPGITACVPVVGHMGICDSRGVIYDFGGPYYISVDSMSFGAPYLYLELDPADCLGPVGSETPRGSLSPAAAAQRWDAAVDAANDDFSRKMHNIVLQNCHHHSASVLNTLGYKGRRNWGQVGVATLVITQGRWVSLRAALCVWLIPLIIAAALGVFFGRR